MRQGYLPKVTHDCDELVNRVIDVFYRGKSPESEPDGCRRHRVTAGDRGKHV